MIHPQARGVGCRARLFGRRRSPRRGRASSAGFIVTVELILIFTIVVIAVVIALAALRYRLATSGVVLQRPNVFDSSAPTPRFIGKVMGYDARSTPFVLRRDLALDALVLLGVRPDRFTTHARVYYTGLGCTGASFVETPRFAAARDIDRFDALQQVAYAVAADAGPGLLLREDLDATPCVGLTCPLILSVWISNWAPADTVVGDPTATDPCRLIPPVLVEGVVPTVEVLDATTGMNFLSGFVPPFGIP